jgi:hypothetical protein
MYLTKEQCNSLLEPFLKESVELLNEYTVLSHEFNLNDFNPSEKKMTDIENRLKVLNTIVEGIKSYKQMCKS